MRKIEDLDFDELTDIVSKIFDAIQNEEMSETDFITDVGLTFVDYGLIR